MHAVPGQESDRLRQERWREVFQSTAKTWVRELRIEVSGERVRWKGGVEEAN